MAFILGIDAGGTHVDSVIFDTENQRILCKAKAFNNRSDFSIGIKESIEKLNFSHINRVTSVHFTSTIPVNTVLEGDYAKTCLVLLGDRINKPLPYYRKYIIYRKDIPETSAYNWEDIVDGQELYQEYIAGADSVVISDYEGDMNRELSLADYFTNAFHVKCACAGGREGDFYQRTLQSLLSAGLKPRLSELYNSVQRVLTECHISAQLFVLNNNGFMVPFYKAVREPLSCIMSGPVASVAGSRFLTDSDTYLLIDMGGTSADVTKIENRVPRMRKGHTEINNYELDIETIDIQSFAIGGDSHIHYDNMGKLTVGPEKVIPLCVAATRFPHLLDEIKTFRKPDDYEMFTAYETDCYAIGFRKLYTTLTNFEKKVVECVKEKPHSLFWLADHFKTDADSLHMKSLVKEGYLQRISFTPTDVLHVTGEYVTWNREVAMEAAHIMAQTGNKTIEEFVCESKEKINNMLVLSCMQSIANFEDTAFDFKKNICAEFLIDKYLNAQNDYMNVSFSLTKPLVALGAPSGAWMAAVADRLKTKLVIPENYDVGSAIGVAVSVQEQKK